MSDPPRPDPPDLAVALRYDGTGAPRVIARGQGFIAHRIVDTARDQGVPIEEDPALAMALAAVELDREIPLELYQAVAAVLSFILRQRDA